MPRLTEKFLYQYGFRPTTALEKSLLALADIGQRIGRYDLVDDTLWSYSRAFTDLLDLHKNNEETALSPEKAAIGLLDHTLFNDVFHHVSQLEDTLTKAGNIGKISGGKENQPQWANYGLQPAVAARWQRSLNELLLPEKEKIIKQTADVQELLGEALSQLRAVGAVIGVTPNVLKTYEFDEWSSLLNESKPYDLSRMIRTLVEYRYGEYKLPAARVVVHLLVQDSLRTSTKYVWEDALILMLMAHLAYGAFAYLDGGLQQVLCERYFYRAIVLGVPVRDTYRDFLYTTETIVMYMEHNARLFTGFENNKEMIPLALANDASKLLADVIKEYLKFANGKSDDEAKQRIFVETLYHDEKHPQQLRAWLGELLSLYFHIQNADLIERNQAGELTEADMFHNDMVQLLAWFGIGADAGGKDLMKYFTQDTPRISLSVFIKNLRSVADLTNDVTVENVTEFTSLLHSNNLLDKDQDLILFDEKDNQFHWNEQLEI